jgi:hypothetical protein
MKVTLPELHNLVMRCEMTYAWGNQDAHVASDTPEPPMFRQEQGDLGVQVAVAGLGNQGSSVHLARCALPIYHCQ